MRQQAWYTGRFATFGMSYLGYTQWSIMAARYDSPRYNYSDAEKRAAAREHAAAVVLVGPHNFADLVWGTGAMWLAAVDWAGATQTMGQKGIARAMWDMVQLTRNPDGDVETKRGVPLLTAVERRFEEGSTLAWLREHVKGSREQIQGERAREYWRRMDQSRALETTEVPVLLVGGWVDVFVRETVKQWRRLDERGVTVGLTMGGRSHADADQDMREMFDWFETHLAQKPDAKRRPARARVQVMTTGPDANKDEWKWFSSWPPANIQPVHLGLAADGQLLFPSDTPSQTKTTTDTASFTFDPHHPTPTYGGDLLFGGGYVDDSALADRSDVLAFTTPPLSRSVEIHGRPRIELLHRSDNPHVDLFIRLCGVEFKSGTAVSRNICQAYQRLDPQRGVGASGGGKTTVKVVLELSDCAHRFHAGTAIRVVVAGGNFPHYSVNLGTGEAQATGTVMRPATHTVVLGEKEGSRLVLPVLTVE
ncbi:galactose-binding domain-like protein [Coniella lustricola]|uniref:Galactose-binding domain-like protein n=1 Tax=Coniella lustricola TaxID=2025994 RepID=A0A2T3A1K4_9PEZI|nr:galactose-binding domain-like protein [Coniella lustricola]